MGRIEINKLVKERANHYKLVIEDLVFSPGITSIVGNNGSGKSTLLNLILDIIRPSNDNCEIKINGILNTREDWKTTTSAYLNEDYLIPYLSINEYLNLIQSLYKIHNSKASIGEELIEKILAQLPSGKTRISNLSAGNKHKVGIAGALVSFPDILILDEPLSSLDPKGQSIVCEALVLLLSKNHNCCVVLSEHNISKMMEISSRVVVLSNGRLEADFKDENITLSKLNNLLL
jgi:ABC-2 type transport system ATP-binding protein